MQFIAMDMRYLEGGMQILFLCRGNWPKYKPVLSFFVKRGCTPTHGRKISGTSWYNLSLVSIKYLDAISWQNKFIFMPFNRFYTDFT